MKQLLRHRRPFPPVRLRRPRANLAVPLRALALLLALPACVGTVGAPPEPPGGDRPAAPGAPAPGDVNRPETVPRAACRPGGSPVPRARLWRLSPQQYANTIDQLYGVKIDPSSLPRDGITNDGITRFDTHADRNLVDDRLAAAFRQHAQTVALAVTQRLPGTPDACVLEKAGDEACVRRSLAAHARRAYRRPATTEELDRLLNFWKAQRQAHDGRVAMRLTLEVLLTSPLFLYRSELGAGPGQGAKVPLTSHELASELSYFLTDGPPDPLLDEAADAGALTDPARLEREAARLLATPRARGKVRAFFEQYLQLVDLVPAKAKDDKKFPGFTAELRRALAQETLTFVEKALFDEKGTLATVFDADYSFQNAQVAKHYGGTLVGSAYQRVPLPAGRRGVLSHASVIATLSNASTTSPVHRGLFFYETLLCRGVPPPPADAANMSDRLSDPENATATAREEWAYFQRTSPACAGCHELFQPLGLGLERFDPVGRLRADDRGKPIDPQVVVTGVGADVDGPYPDALALAPKLLASHAGRTCFALQYATYAFGRPLDGETESCRLEALASAVGDGQLGLQPLLLKMVTDDGFLFRSYP